MPPDAGLKSSPVAPCVTMLAEVKVKFAAVGNCIVSDWVGLVLPTGVVGAVKMSAAVETRVALTAIAGLLSFVVTELLVSTMEPITVACTRIETEHDAPPAKVTFEKLKLVAVKDSVAPEPPHV